MGYQRTLELNLTIYHKKNINFRTASLSFRLSDREGLMSIRNVFSVLYGQYDPLSI